MSDYFKFLPTFIDLKYSVSNFNEICFLYVRLGLYVLLLINSNFFLNILFVFIIRIYFFLLGYPSCGTSLIILCSLYIHVTYHC